MDRQYESIYFISLSNCSQGWLNTYYFLVFVVVFVLVFGSVSTPTMRHFAGIELISDRIRDDTTILTFRHLLEKHDWVSRSTAAQKTSSLRPSKPTSANVG